MRRLAARDPGLELVQVGQARDDLSPVRGGNDGGRPLRGASFSLASRPMADRLRHLRAVYVHTPSRRAIAALAWPAAAASTIVARSRSWSVRGRWPQIAVRLPTQLTADEYKIGIYA